MTDVLDLFSVDKPELGVSEISRMLNLGTSTVHRILASLKSAGLLRQSSNHRYSLGLKMLKYARIVQLQLRYQEFVLPVFQKMRIECNETLAFHLFDGNSRICLFQLESSHQLRRTYTDVGTPLPLYPGSPGKVVLAFLPEKQREEYIQSFALSEASELKLRKEIAFARNNNYAISESERTEGIFSISAPVFDENHQVIAAVNISGPSNRFKNHRVETYSRLLINATHEISQILGYLDS